MPYPKMSLQGLKESLKEKICPARSPLCLWDKRGTRKRSEGQDDSLPGVLNSRNLARLGSLGMPRTQKGGIAHGNANTPVQTSSKKGTSICRCQLHRGAEPGNHGKGVCSPPWPLA